jgi:hypothetical protein
MSERGVGALQPGVYLQPGVCLFDVLGVVRDKDHPGAHGDPRRERGCRYRSHAGLRPQRSWSLASPPAFPSSLSLYPSLSRSPPLPQHDPLSVAYFVWHLSMEDACKHLMLQAREERSGRGRVEELESKTE